MGELLPQLYTEKKIGRRFPGPGGGHRRGGWAVKGAVYLYRVEKLAVVCQFIFFPTGVEVALPGTITRRIAPTGSAYQYLTVFRHVQPIDAVQYPVLNYASHFGLNDRA